MAQHRGIFWIFVLSGAAGLMYEIVWARQLVLVFGNTSQAVSAILTGFFSGLALGSLVGGRVADRLKAPLRAYAYIEFALVAVVLATPALFRGLHELYRVAYDGLERSPELLVLIRFALAIAALAPATVILGATLPTLSRHLARDAGEFGTAFGRLYAANTLGGVVGTLAAGLLLIEVLGLTLTLVAGATCSALAALGALMLERSASTSQRRPPHMANAGKPINSERDVVGRRLAMLAAFVSGLTSLGYQVLWTRLLSSGTGNTTYVFTSILAFFLIAIAAGALLVLVRPPQRTRVIDYLAVVQVVTGLTALLGAMVIGGRLTSLDFGARMMLAIGPATLALGLSLPLSARLVATDDRAIGGDAGKLLAVNTSGVIAATVLLPFFVVPTMGSPAALALLAGVNVTFGLVLVATLSRESSKRSEEHGRRFQLAAVALAAVTAVVGIGFRGAIAEPAAVSVEQRGRVVAASEDEVATVVAGEIGGRKELWVAGSSMTTLTVDAPLMALLPLALRPDARTALVVAFGMGATYRTAVRAGLDTDGVELVPSVPKVFPYYFSDAAAVLADPRGELLISDGRNHVALTSRTYDLIVVDPPPPIRSSGTSILYSLEFYQAAYSRLNPGGVMMEWMPYDQSVDEFRDHVRTFRAVFAHSIVAFGPGGFGTFMLGSEHPMAFREDDLRALLMRPEVLEDLSSPFDSPTDNIEGWTTLIPSLVWAVDEELDTFARDGTLITDDRPRTEYFLLRSRINPASPPASRESLLSALR